MTRTALLLALLSACSLRDPRSSGSAAGPACAQDSECRGDVCFLGQCRPASAGLAVVSAEIRPGTDSSFGTSQVAGLDLHASAEQDFALRPALSATGHVTLAQAAGTTSVAGASLTFTDHAPAISDRVQQISAQTDASGAFTVRLPAGVWDALVVPPAPLPPFRSPQPLLTSASNLDYTLPAQGSLARASGAVVTVSATSALAGATVAAVTAQGGPLSAAGQLGADGSYSLLLPPATSAFFLEVGPPAADAGVASADLASLPNYNQLPGVQSVVVDLPPPATIQGHVHDASGAVLARVPVFASSSGEPWSLARSTVTDANGAFVLQLRAGTFLIEAAPSAAADQPAASTIGSLVLPASGATLDLICPPKLQRSQQILLADGRPAGAGFQVTAMRVSDPILSGRSATTTVTDSKGVYQIVGDPGVYRLEIAPPIALGLPRRIVEISLDSGGSTELPAIVLQTPLTVVGTVHGAPKGGKDGPVASATVSFFATDATGSSVLLGTALTDAAGHYTCVLPDLGNP